MLWKTMGRVGWTAYPLQAISSTEASDFPLQSIRYASRAREMQTYEPRSVLKILGGTATHFFRVFVDIQVGPSVEVLDLVNPWP